jgi:hypothetical protein
LRRVREPALPVGLTGLIAVLDIWLIVFFLALPVLRPTSVIVGGRDRPPIRTVFRHAEMSKTFPQI